MATIGDISGLETLQYDNVPLEPLTEGFVRRRKSGVIASGGDSGASVLRRKFFNTVHVLGVTYYLESRPQQDYIQAFINVTEGQKFIAYLTADRPILEPYVVQAVTDWEHSEVTYVDAKVSVTLEVFSTRNFATDQAIMNAYAIDGDDDHPLNTTGLRTL